MKIKGRNKKPEPQKVFYICNRKRCNNCTSECKHTADINFALYEDHTEFEFMVTDGSLWEVHRGGEA